MTAHSKPYPQFELLLSTFSDWLKHRRELNEMRQLDRTEFDRIASDLRVSPSELEELVRHGPHAADELPKLLKALGIDEVRSGERSAAGAARHGAGLRDVPAEGAMRPRSRRWHVA